MGKCNAPEPDTALVDLSITRSRCQHRTAMEWTNREGHAGLAGRRIGGGERSNRKAGHVERDVLTGGMLSAVA